MAIIQAKEWLGKTEAYHLTIKDILEMKEGDIKRILFFDRNFSDNVFWAKMQTKTKTKVFVNALVDMSHTIFFEKKEGICGNFVWVLKGRNKREKDSFIEERDRWFEIEYEKDSWYPLNKEGILEFDEDEVDYPADYKVDDDDDFDVELVPMRVKYAHLHGKRWDEFPPETKVGWRGPCMELKNLRHLPRSFNTTHF